MVFILICRQIVYLIILAYSGNKHLPGIEWNIANQKTTIVLFPAATIATSATSTTISSSSWRASVSATISSPSPWWAMVWWTVSSHISTGKKYRVIKVKMMQKIDMFSRQNRYLRQWKTIKTIISNE